ncbi:MAG: DMT family transporter [Cellvibrio sp.]|uniref:DMT family transporter n=1 Tax=Cellvibrio sp. TaxID=1965322 RepID=UPI0031A83F45
MAVLFAYFSVVLIWATTPLAIQWSSDSISFMAAAALRIAIALAIALLIHGLLRKSLATYWQHAQIYFAASISIFPNMPVVYWGVQFIPSGLVVVIFAMSPFVTGLMTLLLLKQNPFTLKKVIALMLALVGLVIIFYHQFQFNARSIYGIASILLSCLIFSFSSVWVKKLIQQQAVTLDAFHQISGALLFSLPGLLLCWWLVDGALPQAVSVKSGASILYLAIMGSLVGGALFYFILQRMSASAVSLITLMTPVLAIIIGKHLADEELSSQTLIGVAIVLFALLLYLPWSIRAVAAKVDAWLLHQMTKPVPDESETSVQEELQKIKDYVIRFK